MPSRPPDRWPGKLPVKGLPGAKWRDATNGQGPVWEGDLLPGPSPADASMALRGAIGPYQDCIFGVFVRIAVSPALYSLRPRP